MYQIGEKVVLSGHEAGSNDYYYSSCGSIEAWESNPQVLTVIGVTAMAHGAYRIEVRDAEDRDAYLLDSEVRYADAKEISGVAFRAPWVVPDSGWVIVKDGEGVYVVATEVDGDGDYRYVEEDRNMGYFTPSSLREKELVLIINSAGQAIVPKTEGE